MTSKNIANGLLRTIAILVGIIVLATFLYKIQSVLVYIVIAGVLSLIARPFIQFLKTKLKFPNTLAVSATMLCIVGVFIGIMGLFIPLLIQQSESLSLLQSDKLQVSLQDISNQANQYLLSHEIDLLNQLKKVDYSTPFKAIPNILNTVVGTVGSLSVGLFSVLFITFFFMKDSHLLKNAALTLIPNKAEGRFSKSLEKINHLLSRYFIGLVLQISILFVLYTILLLVFGISNAIVIAFLCALLNLIPYVGPMIGAVLMFILAMTSNLGSDFQTEILPTATSVLIGYLLAQLIDNFFSQPHIFSRTTKSHPLEIFLIIVIGGLLFGVIGMIVAVPTYTALKVILKEFFSENKIVQSLTKDL